MGLGGETSLKFKKWLSVPVSQTGKDAQDTEHLKGSEIKVIPRATIQGEKWPDGSAQRSGKASDSGRGSQGRLLGGSVWKAC